MKRKKKAKVTDCTNISLYLVKRTKNEEEIRKLNLKPKKEKWLSVDKKIN